MFFFSEAFHYLIFIPSGSYDLRIKIIQGENFSLALKKSLIQSQSEEVDSYKFKNDINIRSLNSDDMFLVAYFENGLQIKKIQVYYEYLLRLGGEDFTMKKFHLWKFDYENWSQCSQTCGKGIKRLKAKCYEINMFNSSIEQDETLCETIETKPTDFVEECINISACKPG